MYYNVNFFTVGQYPIQNSTKSSTEINIAENSDSVYVNNKFLSDKTMFPFVFVFYSVQNDPGTNFN